MGPSKYLFEKLTLMGRMVRWLLLLTEFDWKFKPWRNSYQTSQGAENQEFEFLNEELIQTLEEVW